MFVRHLPEELEAVISNVANATIVLVIALAITTMASAPATALAATLGIAAMTAVLIRAAS